MGEIRVVVQLQNAIDAALKRRRKPVRSAEVEAVVDTGAVMTLLPEEIVAALGLERRGSMTAVLANDQKIELQIARNLQLTVVGREMTTDCLIGPVGCIPLVGQLVMERLDLIADPGKGTLTVRPDSPFRPTLALRSLAPALA